MQVVIPAAGRGQRLTPKTNSRPKPMVRVGGQPIIEYVLNDVIASVGDLDLEEVILIVGYQQHQIIDYLGEEFAGHAITYVQQEKPKGLGHAVGTARDVINGPFYLRLGDAIFWGNTDDLMQQYAESAADGVILVETVKEGEAGKEATVTLSQEGEVLEVTEKPENPSTQLVETGCYVFPEEMASVCTEIECSPARGEYELQTATNAMIADGYWFDAVHFNGRRININTIEDLKRAESLV